MYMKVPPANELKTISIISFDSYRAIPIPTPIGAANANANSKVIALLISSLVLKFLLKETPKDIASGDLCIKRAIIILIVPDSSFVNPKAIPSNIACVLRAINKTKDLQLNLHLFVGLFC